MATVKNKLILTAFVYTYEDGTVLNDGDCRVTELTLKSLN